MSQVVEAEISFGTRLANLARGGRPMGPADESTGRPGVENGLAGTRNERDFIALKNPKGHPETATVLGFWLTVQGANEFLEDDIRRAYVRAGVRPPKVVSQALRDAKRYLDSIERGSKRGMYRLTAHGDRIVRFDLPGK